MLVLRTAVSIIATFCLSVGLVFGDDSPNAISYHKQIRPIFQAKCQGCHQPAKASGDYIMTGTCGGLIPLRSGDRAEADFGILGSVNLTVHSVA